MSYTICHISYTILYTYLASRVGWLVESLEEWNDSSFSLEVVASAHAHACMEGIFRIGRLQIRVLTISDTYLR